jgi:uncharacterized protein (TIGR02600 family)
MKTDPSPSHSLLNLQRPASGSALLLALGLVALLTLLTAAFLLVARTEFTSSKFYARGVNTKLLSDTALNLVTAQIGQATRSTDALSGSVVAWASQPGMIRTFDTAGNAVSNYKLYSWDNMAVAAGSFSQAEEVPPSGWDAQKDVWTDLNEPVQTSSNGPIYPILQGSNPVAGISLQTGLTDVYGKSVPGKSYHLSSDSGAAASLADVEGFSVGTAPSQTAANPVNPDVPMPVKWLYVLQDGTTVAAQSSGGGAASVPGASSANKIVGRIAFWTDDETSKVNINTASEGNFWDVPLADGREERTLAVNIPVQGEYQRIPGHPATVSLSSVFGGSNQLFPSVWNPPNQVNLDPTLTADVNTLKQTLFGTLPNAIPPVFYGLTPRMAWGGTQFGTAPYSITAETAASPAYFQYGNTPGSGITGGAQHAPAALVTKANRLYSTIDELLFQPTTGATPTRTPNLNMTAAALDQAKFFITANSRAPEVTLFNTPRISIWPITWPNTGIVSGSTASVPVTNAKPDPLATNPFYTNTAPPMLMPEEKLLAFCGTVGGNPYYFQRQNAYDPQADYLKIPRNQQLMAYLDTMTTHSIPGFGGDFGGKYGNDRPQILTEIFDYIRSGPNLNNSVADGSGNLEVNYNYSPVASRNFYSANYFQTPPGATANNGGTSSYGGADVVPINITHGGVATHGAGRFPTVTEAALVFYAADRKDPQPGTPNSADPSGPNGQWEFISKANPSVDKFSGSQTTSVGMFLLLNIYNPVTGRLSNSPFFVAEITGTPFTINGSSVLFPQSSASNGQTLINMGAISSANNSMLSNDAYMGSIWTMAGYFSGNGGYGKALNRNAYPGISPAPQLYSPASAYPFYGDPQAVSPTSNTFQFVGSVATLKIYPVIPGAVGFPPDTTNGPIQTITLDFSQLSGTYPTPLAPEYANAALAGDGTTSVTSLTLPSTVTVPEADIYRRGYYYFSRTNSAPAGSVDTSGTPPSSPWNGAWDARNLLARNYCLQNPNNSFCPAVPGKTIGYPSLTNNGPFPLITQAYNVVATTGQPMNADTVISLHLNPAPLQKGGVGGDARLIALNSSPPKKWFVPHYAVSTNQGATFPVHGAHSLAIGQNQTGPASDAGGSTSFLLTTTPPNTTRDSEAGSLGYIRYESMFGYLGNNWPAFSQQVDNAGGNATAWVGQNTTAIAGLTPANPVVGDFSNGIGYYTDGAIIPKPDDTTFSLNYDPNPTDRSVSTPYFYNYGVQSTDPYFSPARQLSGPVAFGMLPTGAQSGTPWQTLAFNPNPMVGMTHPGLQSPKDHLLLDLFWMPVVEPYAISEPLSTAGKINLNYEIEPFTYISRKTALYAAMKSDKIFAIPNAAKGVYKNADTNSGGLDYAPSAAGTAGFPYGTPAVNTWSFHFPIDIATTLQQFDTVFGTGTIFKSASQICEIFLQPRANPLYTPPAGVTLPTPDSPGSTSNISGWWASANTSTNMTGANGRQQPYAHLYSLLTTKSNTFQVHMRVQVLTKNSTGNQAVFDESAGDSVVGEYRGSAIVERYVDPNDTTLPDFASTFTTAGQNTLDPYYRFRIVSTKAFTPR